MKGLITNDWDRDNLNFLLNTKGDDFADWYDQSDEDDKVYAQELMDAYSRELKLRSELIEVEAKLELAGYGDALRVIDRVSKS
jgi:hypothetical protein